MNDAYAILVKSKSKHHALSYYYSSDAISIIEKNIPLYANRHPKASICYTWVDENISIDNQYLLKEMTLSA